MYIVAIAWAFVVLLMTLTEATSTQGTILGALFTFFGYGVLPLGIVLYVMGAPMRRRARLKIEQQERDDWQAQQERQARLSLLSQGTAAHSTASPQAQPVDSALSVDAQSTGTGDSANPDSGSMPPRVTIPPVGKES